MSEDDDHFQVILLGTGLTESIAAAALAKAGYTVAHIDVNAYYGSDEASLLGKDLTEWIQAHVSASSSKYHSVATTGSIPDPSRSYCFSLSPSILPARGPLIDALVASGVARYGGFRLLPYISVYDKATSAFKSVPANKEDIFKSKELHLLDKRRLMRFLQFAAGEFEDRNEYKGCEEVPFVAFLQSAFSLSNELATVITYALALCQSDIETTSVALMRLRKTLRSAGRYGDSPFLLGLYGGLGEISQGFCRVSAVARGVYILGHTFSVSLVDSPKTVSLNSDDPSLPDKLSADLIIISQDLLPHITSPAESKLSTSLEAQKRHEEKETLRYVQLVTIVIVDGILGGNRPGGEGVGEVKSEEKEIDASDGALFVYPPGSLEEGRAPGPVSALVNGEGTNACPKGQCILYLSTTLVLSNPSRSCSSRFSAENPQPDVDPASLLAPYMEAVLTHIKSPTGIPAPVVFSVSYAKTLEEPVRFTPNPTPLDSNSTMPLPASAPTPHSETAAEGSPPSTPSPVLPRDPPNPPLPLPSHSASEPTPLAAHLREYGVLVASPPATLASFPNFAETGDVCAIEAEWLFREGLKILKREDEQGVPFWPPLLDAESEEGLV